MSEAIVNIHDPEALVHRYYDDPRPDLKDMIMVQYAGLVERVARRFAGLEAQEDLVQVGFIGLLNALSKFDPKAGVKFNTYATHLVAGEIKHYLRDRSQTIRQPAWLQELRHKVKRTSGILQGKLGRPATEAEIAAELSVAESLVQEVLQTQEVLNVGSLDQGIQGDDDGATEVDQIEDLSGVDELALEDRVVLEAAIQQLRELERDVLVHFHFDSMTQTEIASRLGISCNYVSHILRQSLAKLRRILANEDDGDRLLRGAEQGLDEVVLDSVTGVYSEEYFHGRLSEEVHRASSGEGVLSLVLIGFEGVDSLKSFYGDASVKDFLADCAQFLRERVRRLDIVCRWSESGFAIILPSTGPSVDVVVQRLTQKIEPWLQSRRAPTGPIKAVFGRAVYPDEAISPKDLVEKASPSSTSSESREAA